MPSLAIVSVHYYPHCLEASLREVERIAGLAPPERCVLISNNSSLHETLLALAQAHAVVDAVELHDNRGLEFGAYQRGLDHVTQQGDFDWVLFVNDTVATHQLFCSRHRKALAARLGEPQTGELPVAVGRVDSLPRSYALHGARSHRWITTNVFALNRRALEVLGGRVHHAELDALIRTTADLGDFFSPEMDEVLVNHLKAWLFGAAPGPRWREAAPLAPGNAERYAGKARAILQEKYLSARLDEGKAFFADLRKLSDLDRLRCRGEQVMFKLCRSLRARGSSPT
jgi:hypothetical protein